MCDLWRPRPSPLRASDPSTRPFVTGEESTLGLSFDGPQDDCEIHEMGHMVTSHYPQADPPPPEMNFDPPTPTETQSRGRIILSVALLIQVGPLDVMRLYRVLTFGYLCIGGPTMDVGDSTFHIPSVQSAYLRR